MKEKIVLGFSGGLDTSYCVFKLREEGYEPVCVALDVGQNINKNIIEQKAIDLEIKELRFIDAKNEFANYFIAPSIWANALYQDIYPLSTALSRPLIGKYMVDIAKEIETDYFAHGCTGKGNDQIRLEVTINALKPNAHILAPIRDNNLSRDEEIDYLDKKGIKISVTKNKPYSIDENLWGRSICAGILEDLEAEIPNDVYSWTVSPLEADPDGDDISIIFEEGIPTTLNGKEKSLCNIINELNIIAGKQGIGRIDHIEDRLVGIKSREIYETPAALTIIKAHQILESLTQTRISLEFKRYLEGEYSKLIYNGNWFTSHHFDLLAYLKHNQKNVTGKIDLKLLKGNIIVLSRNANLSLYDKNLVSYGNNSTFNQRAAKGYIDIVSMESKIGIKSSLLNDGYTYAHFPKKKS